LISHIDSLRISFPTQRVIVGGDFDIIPTDADLSNPDHPDWETHAMCSHRERQLYEDFLRLGYEDIVAQRLPHRPYTHWIYYRSATDQCQGFCIDYFFTPSFISHQITSAHVLLHWRAMPEASDHAPVRIIINPNH
jgi:exodeoxyribonuclease-3